MGTADCLLCLSMPDRLHLVNKSFWEHTKNIFPQQMIIMQQNCEYVHFWGYKWVAMYKPVLFSIELFASIRWEADLEITPLHQFQCDLIERGRTNVRNDMHK